MSITYETLLVSPEMAANMLAHAAPNRGISKSRVDAMIASMHADRWHQDGSPIRFNASGLLCDGQHRLTAVVRSGKAQAFLVVSGVSDAAMDVIDSGTTRTPTCVLDIHQTGNGSRIASALRWLLMYETDSWKAAPPLRNDTVLDIAAGYHGLAECCSVSSRFPFLSRGLSVGSFYLTKQIDSEEAERFFVDLELGASLHVDDPVLVARERLLKLYNGTLLRRARTASGNGRMAQREQTYYVVTAWNMRRKNRKANTMRYVDNYPMPKVAQ